MENFELPVTGQSSVLLIGNNGSGKTTVGLALEVLQRIARGTNRVDSLIKPKDFARGRTDAPMRFEIEVELNAKIYKYTIAFGSSEGFKDLRVFAETLTVDEKFVFARESAEVHLARAANDTEANFFIDWHLVALPILQEQSSADPLFLFKQWLARMLILRPIPSLITGDSDSETLEPNPQVTDFGAWFYWPPGSRAICLCRRSTNISGT